LSSAFYWSSARSTLAICGFPPPEWVTKIWDKEGRIQSTTPNRNSAFFEIGSAYCLKISLPDEENPEIQKDALKVFFAREYAFHWLCRLMGFQATPSGIAVQLNYHSSKGNHILWMVSTVCHGERFK